MFTIKKLYFRDQQNHRRFEKTFIFNISIYCNAFSKKLFSQLFFFIDAFIILYPVQFSKLVGIEMGIECIFKVIYLAYLIRNAQTQPMFLVSTSFIYQKQLTRYTYVILDIQTPQYKISIPLKGNKIKCTVVLIKFCFIYLRNRKKSFTV